MFLMLLVLDVYIIHDCLIQGAANDRLTLFKKKEPIMICATGNVYDCLLLWMNGFSQRCLISDGLLDFGDCSPQCCLFPFLPVFFVSNFK